jgi:glycosyltransferase involved in cell wall biosynthesis
MRKQMDKVDLVMWAKNGERFLPSVLKQVETVVPHENVDLKIFVDDSSTDRTREIAKEFNWTVHSNSKGGIPAGANEGLRHVKSEFFVSIEQDVILAKDWWERIPPYMDDENVAVAQGMRVATDPTLRKLEEYISGRQEFAFFISIDNNIFRTKVIRLLGGFPTVHPLFTDSALYKKIAEETRLRWIVDRKVVSQHIKENVEHFIEHLQGFETIAMRASRDTGHSFPRLVRLFLTSPARGLLIVYKTHELNFLWIYPRVRLAYLKAYGWNGIQRGDSAKRPN